jgi:hypothetical protein
MRVPQLLYAIPHWSQNSPCTASTRGGRRSRSMLRPPRTNQHTYFGAPEHQKHTRIIHPLLACIWACLLPPVGQDLLQSSHQRGAPSLHIYSIKQHCSSNCCTNSKAHNLTHPDDMPKAAHRLANGACVCASCGNIKVVRGLLATDRAHPGWQSPAHACGEPRATSKQHIHTTSKLDS